MMDFKGSPEVKKQDERKKLDAIVPSTGVKKTGETNKFFRNLVSDDAKNVGGYLNQNVVIPSLKRMITDFFKTGIDFIFYGTKGSSSGGPGRISYWSGINGSKQNNTFVNAPQARPDKPTAYSLSDIIFNERSYAENVLIRMKEQIEMYKMCSIADLYDLMGEKSNYTDAKWGWKNLDMADVVRNGNGYSIQFPKVIQLD